MATATAKKQPKPKAAFLELPVSFGGVSIGDKTARLGVSLERSESLTVAQADKSLCGCRLTGKVVARIGDAVGEQDPLPGLDAGDTVLDATFDVKQLSITPTSIGFGLTFAIKGLDVGELAHFAKRSGKLIVYEVAEIPEEREEEEEDGDSAFDEQE